MTSHRDVADRLCGSDTEARQRQLQGTNMAYRPPTDDFPAAVTGYDWACYAVRIRGNLILFRDWEGYSASTTKHLNILERAARRHGLNLVHIHAGNSATIKHGRPSLHEVGEWLPDKPEKLGTATERKAGKA